MFMKLFFMNLKKSLSLTKKKKMKVSGTYTIPYEKEMSILNLENVYVDVNTEDEAAEITLPKISEMAQKNVKFYFNFDANFESNFSLTVFPAEGDTISGAEEVVLQPSDRGFWLLAQNTDIWSMASSEFVPSSLIGLDATIGYTDGQFNVEIEGGLAPFEIKWTLPQIQMAGYTIDGPDDEESVELLERPNTDPFQPAFFVPQTGPTEIRPQFLKVKVTDALGNVAKDFYYIMAVQNA